MYDDQTLADLVDQFAAGVIEQTEAIWDGDAERSNRAAGVYIDAFLSLRKIGDPGRDALAVLFEHPSPDVRLAAAGYLLRYRHTDAMRVLREVAAGVGMHAFTAQQCIQRWNEGEWELDLESDEA